MLGLFQSPPLGVDLGSGSVKVVGRKGNKIFTAAYMDIPPSEREEETLLINRLHNFFKELDMLGQKAVVDIPGNLSFIRTITLPLMPKSELKEAVKWEIKRQLPYSPEEAVYDYVAMTMAEGIVVTFASAERSNVNRYIFPLTEAGINVIAVDVNSLCLLRALAIKGSGNIVVLDIGAKSMEIDIIKSGALRMTRSIDIGGDTIRSQLLSEGFAEEGVDGILKECPAERANEVLNQFLNEIFRSMDYYKATFKERVFSEVFLTGGVAISHVVRDYFSHMFDIPVSVPNPFDGFAMKDETLRHLGPRFSVAIGLARRIA